MRIKSSEGEKYQALLASLDRTVIDPAEWGIVCDRIADLVDASGSLLMPYDEEDRGFAQPHSSSIGELFHRYISSGWHKRDFRSKGFPKAITAGFVTDQDLITPEEMRKHPYYAELLAPAGLQWFVGISFNVNGKIWGAAVQGTPQRGPFQLDEIEKLLRAREDIAFSARRVAALGFQRIESLDKTFASARRGVAALGWSGRITWLNARAEALLRDAELLSKNRLRSQDPTLDRRLADLVDSALGHRSEQQPVMPPPLLVPIPDDRQISIDVLALPRDFHAVLSGASAMLSIHEVASTTSNRLDARARFRLTGREFELAVHLIEGKRVAEAAEEMGMSVSTARQHLKSILSKTGTHRQAELVALLVRHS